MTDIIYDRALDDLSDWETGDFVWLLAKNPYFPDAATDQFVSHITDEVTLASYDRVAPTTPVREVNTTTHQIRYKCDDVDFGILETTEDPRWLILARLTDATPVDTTNELICCLDLGAQGVTPLASENFIVHLHPQGFLTTRQVAG